MLTEREGNGLSGMESADHLTHKENQDKFHNCRSSWTLQHS